MNRAVEHGSAPGWTAEIVLARLIEAADVIARSSARAGPRGYLSAWPEALPEADMRSLLKAASAVQSAGGRQTRPPPSAAAVSRSYETFEWWPLVRRRRTAAAASVPRSGVGKQVEVERDLSPDGLEPKDGRQPDYGRTRQADKRIGEHGRQSARGRFKVQREGRETARYRAKRGAKRGGARQEAETGRRQRTDAGVRRESGQERYHTCCAGHRTRRHRSGCHPPLRTIGQGPLAEAQAPPRADRPAAVVSMPSRRQRFIGVPSVFTDAVKRAGLPHSGEPICTGGRN